MRSNQDLHDNIRAMRVVTPVAIGTTGTGKTGVVIDRQGYGGVEFVFAYGSITATNATITPTLLEGDVTGTLTSVADADMLPVSAGEAAAGVAAAATRTSGVSKNVVKRLGYRGPKRYVTAKVISTVTAGPLVGVEAILFNPSIAATSNP